VHKVRVGVIGVGNMGQHHARIYSQMPNVELTGVVDIDEERGRSFSDRYNTHYYADYTDLLDKVDAINIVVPTSLHYPMAMEFMNRDVHVLVEKPITIDLLQAKDLVEIAKQRDLVLQVGHLERFNPAVAELRKIVRKPFYFQSHRLSYPTNRNLDVGVVWDLMIHDLDIMANFINSTIIDVNSIGVSSYSEHEDMAVVHFLFKNGSVANLVASRISGEKLRQLKIIEKNKTFELDFTQQTLAIMRPPTRFKTNPPEYIPIKKEEPLRLELEHFIECVTMRKEPIVTGEDGKRALDLAMQVVEKMKIIKDSSPLGQRLIAMTDSNDLRRNGDVLSEIPAFVDDSYEEDAEPLPSVHATG